MVTAAVYAYLDSSSIDDGLLLQTSGGPTAHPRFCTGFLTRPARGETEWSMPTSEQ